MSSFRVPLDPDVSAAVAAALATVPHSTPLSGISPSADASGFKVTFSKPYKDVPIVYPVAQWSGTQLVIPSISNITATGCTVTVMRSKGTLVLSLGPFEVAPAGTAYLLVPYGVIAS